MSAKWRNYQGTEPQHYQAHFNEICDLVGHPKPADDLSDTDFDFQKSAPTPDNRLGKADVFLRDHFVMEYKKPGKSLEDAYFQALRYRDSLGNPNLIIVSDFETIQIRTNFPRTVSDVYTITLDDLLYIERNATRRSALGIVSESPLSVYQVLRYCFFQPGNLKPSVTPEQLTNKAADVFKEISDELQTWNPGKDAETARFLSQILFCMFASDVGLLKKQLITEFTQELGDSPAIVFPERLRRLFDAMSDGDQVASPPIKRFNGGLFDGTPHNLRIGASIMPSIREADALDWSQIEPAIFGTLFERIYNPEKRAQQGRHYTSRNDIETLVEPVVMTPLRRNWANVKSAIDVGNVDETLSKLQAFLDSLGEIRILDPACGSGNFLYVALDLMHALEREVIRWAMRLEIHGLEPRVHPRQLLGIEAEEYAHQLASVVVWIGHLQNGVRVGNVAERDPILDPLENINCRDAIVDDTNGEPNPAGWPEVDFIVGNPPFLGNRRMRQELGDETVERIYKVWGDRVPNGADLCAYWFENARIHIAQKKAKRAGLLATQAIRGGASRHVLANIKETGDIFFGVSDRDWILDGAAVHISMVGFDDGTEPSRTLDDKAVNNIYANLTSGSVDTTQARRLAENIGIAFQGVIPVGPFDISSDEAMTLLTSTNPKGVNNADVIRRLISAKDITVEASNRWIIDFGVDTPKSEASEYEAPFDLVQERVIPHRSGASSAQSVPWWLFASTRPGLRAAIEPISRFIVTPRVAKHRVFVWTDADTLPNESVVIFASEDDYFMGILHSRVHEVWTLAMGTQVRDRESGFRYTHTTCFETFPMPEPTDEQRDAIADIAKTNMWHRENSLSGPYALDKNMKKQKNTLTNLYNRNPSWLRADHENLDRAVFDAYGWTEDPADVTDDTILERLLELNLIRTPA